MGSEGLQFFICSAIADAKLNMQDESVYVRGRPALNPYLFGLYAIYHRLLWDLQPAAWISRSRVLTWKDRFVGRKAVIVCNGPSLLGTNLSQLDGVFTFGLNKINLLFDRDEFRPSCIVAVNPLVIEQNADFINSTDIPHFVNSAGRRHVRLRRNVAFLYSWSTGFARDCSMAVNEGHTVTFVAMQLAFHMGFTDVALIGCDHTFATKGPANKTVTAEGEDQNHFDRRYFSGGVQWQLPDFEASEFHYHIARRAFEANDRRLVNSTVGGVLEVFERMPLERFLAT